MASSSGIGIDDFELEGLARKACGRSLTGQFLLLETHVFRDGLAHAGLDAVDVLRREWPGNGKVVVEAVVGGRADGEHGLREEVEHGLGHDVCSRVTDAKASVVALLLLR